MTRSEFKRLVENGFLFLDGATGSNLQKSGMPAGVCPEKWILDNQEVMIDLQCRYLEAGTNIIYAPTFTANRVKLSEYGLESQIEKINHDLVAISKEAVRRAKEKNPEIKAYVAADLSMTGKQMRPLGNAEFEDIVEVYKEQVSYLIEAGVDLIVIETIISLQDARAALLACREVCDLPVMVTISFEESGKSLFGSDAKTVMAVLQSLGADAVGANCSTGPDKLIPIISGLAEIAQIPVIAKPNAGMPHLNQDGSTSYDMSKEEFVKGVLTLIEKGATVLGGCCGTDPEYIAALTKTVKEIPFKRTFSERVRYLSSERQTLTFGLNSPFIIVGERINPTGKKLLQDELRNQNFDMVVNFAQQQEEHGAGLLDINMGMGGIDEEQTMLKAIEEVTQCTSLPLSIDTSHVSVMEHALREYPGRALMNSISLEKVKFDTMLPLAAKYGAMFILLPLSDEGLPKNLTEKKNIIRTIMERALSLGMHKEDIIVDGLVATVGANKNAALETLETIRYCKEELGLATIIGLSNISFGLPDRVKINSSFLTMAIQAGLTMAIANPSQELLVSSALAADLLLAKDASDIRYIDYANMVMESNALRNANMAANTNVPNNDAGSLVSQKVNASNENVGSESIEELLKTAVLKGRRNQVVDLTKKLLEGGLQPQDVLNQILMPAINEVGELFEKGKYFLPQLIASAETMKIAIEYLEPMLLSDQTDGNMPTIVIATVEGDIHDIGKNLVVLMLKNYGFHVIDLGKDVSKEVIVQSAIDEKADIIALSALMTTTMQQMKEVILHAREKAVAAKVMIGGAVITQDYADEIGADGYSKDAAEAVKVAKRLLEIEQ